jgi:hypothetical protein
MPDRGGSIDNNQQILSAIAALSLKVATLQQQVTTGFNNVLARIKTMSDSVATELANLTQDVTNETTVEASAITLIEGFAAQLAAAQAAASAAGATPAQLASFATLGTNINTSSAALAAAVAANTEAASS